MQKGTAYMHTWNCVKFLEALTNGLFYERPQNPFMFLQGCIDRVVENERGGLTGKRFTKENKNKTMTNNDFLGHTHPHKGGVRIRLHCLRPIGVAPFSLHVYARVHACSFYNSPFV